MLAGIFTGFVQSPARQVIERIKSVMQVAEIKGGKSQYNWAGDCVINLIRQQGFRKGLFQGMGSTLLREVPQFAVYYPCYELSKELYIKSGYLNTTAAQFFAGGTAGVIQWLPPFYCFDVIKSRMQTAPEGRYASISDCAKSIYLEGGFKAFFR